ncbi:hypothetical protein U6G28_10605 [Actinomycetaceae bacterium MB13-C1-2]|nr:hypothetical protein U6G28_10605 [Actinomycetaceae bacterium MB13-C1-2]
MCKIGSSSRSRAKLLAAVTAVLDATEDIERVTITDIVNRAGLTRPTFYAAFDDLPTAFAAAALARLEDAFADLDAAVGDVDEGRAALMRENFTIVLRRLSDNAEFFARVLRGPGGGIVQARLVEFVASRLRRHSPASVALARGPLPVEMTSAALAAGVMWTMLRWLEDDPRMPVPELAAQLSAYVEMSVFKGLGTGAQVV